MQVVNGVMEPLENNFTENPSRWSGLSVRLLSAVALGIVAFTCIWLGGIVFIAFVMLASIIMKKEWDLLTLNISLLERMGGYVYIVLPCASLIWLRNLSLVGFSITLLLIAIITATDTGAYFIGRRFGRHKLSPVISPNKTWEGLGGGIIAAIVSAGLISSCVAIPHPIFMSVGVAPILAILGQTGDLFESSLKRRAGVKDSGSLLPGHGGMLDRFDGYMFTTPVFALFIYFIQRA